MCTVSEPAMLSTPADALLRLPPQGVSDEIPGRRPNVETRESASEAAPAKRKRPGRKQGATGELTSFWQVKQGHEKQLRAVSEGLQEWPLEKAVREC
jgi:hypothetical protein